MLRVLPLRHSWRADSRGFVPPFRASRARFDGRRVLRVLRATTLWCDGSRRSTIPPASNKDPEGRRSLLYRREGTGRAPAGPLGHGALRHDGNSFSSAYGRVGDRSDGGLVAGFRHGSVNHYGDSRETRTASCCRCGSTDPGGCPGGFASRPSRTRGAVPAVETASSTPAGRYPGIISRKCEREIFCIPFVIALLSAGIIEAVGERTIEMSLPVEEVDWVLMALVAGERSLRVKVK